MSAWDRFFCSTCQTERLITERQYIDKRPRCTSCIAKRVTPAKRGGRAKLGADPYHGEYDHSMPALPQTVLDSYSESVSE